MITFGKVGRQLFAGTFDELPICVAGNMDHLKLFKQSTEMVQHSQVDRVRALAPTEDQKHRKLAGDPEVVLRSLAIPQGKFRAKWVARFIDSFVKELLRLFGCH